VNNESQSIVKFNEEIKDQMVSVRLKSGKEIMVENVNIQPDSTCCDLAFEQHMVIFPTDSISEIVNADFNFNPIPKPTIIGALVGTIYTVAFRPTYRDESDVEHRVSIPRGLMFGGFFGLVYGMMGSAGTVYRISNDSEPKLNDAANLTKSTATLSKKKNKFQSFTERNVNR
jgi:hypothetical protein